MTCDYAYVKDGFLLCDRASRPEQCVGADNCPDFMPDGMPEMIAELKHRIAELERENRALGDKLAFHRYMKEKTGERR